MDIKLFKRDNLNLPAWENLAREGSFFHSCDWIDVCLEGLEKNSEAIYLCLRDGNDIIAGMPAVITSRHGFKSFLSLPYGTYGSVLYRPDVEERSKREFSEYIIQYLDKQRFSFIELVDFYGHLANCGLSRFEILNCFTHLLELKNKEAFKPARDRVERHIRSGLKNQVEISPMDGSGRVDEFYELYGQTEKRHGRSKPMYGKKFFRAVLDQLNGSDALYWVAALHEGRMIGSHINFIYGDTLYYWQGVMDYDKREFKPGYLLMHDSINRAINLGLGRINLGASPPEAEGLIDYKESWGARKQEYSIYRRKSLLRRMAGR